MRKRLPLVTCPALTNFGGLFKGRHSRNRSVRREKKRLQELFSQAFYSYMRMDSYLLRRLCGEEPEWFSGVVANWLSGMAYRAVMKIQIERAQRIR